MTPTDCTYNAFEGFWPTQFVEKAFKWFFKDDKMGQTVIDELLSVWWTLIPFVILLLLGLWELSPQRKRANEERIRRLDEEVEKLKKENK